MDDAEEGPTNFSITLYYENWEVTSATASQTLPISVKQPLRVEISAPNVYDNDADPGDPVAINLNIVNKGRSKIYNVGVDVAGMGLSMYEDYYGGDVLPAAKLSADVLVASEQTGEREGTLLVSYEDSTGELFTQEVPFSMLIPEVPEPTDQIQTGELEQPKSPISTGAIVGGSATAAAAAGGGIWWWLKRRNKSAVS